MFPHLDPHFEFDTHFDKIPKNQCFHPFSHHQKSPLSHQKYLSSPYKIRLQSNSTKNHIFNKEITHQNTPIYNSSIPQNTSKTNTFSQRKIHKQYHSIEVIFFVIKFIYKPTSNFSYLTFISYIWKLLSYTTHTTSTPNIPYLKSLYKSMKMNLISHKNHFNDKILT